MNGPYTPFFYAALERESGAVTIEAPRWRHRQRGRAIRPLSLLDSDALLAAVVQSFFDEYCAPTRAAFAVISSSLGETRVTLVERAETGPHVDVELEIESNPGKESSVNLKIK